MTADIQTIVDLIALERDAIQFLAQRGFKVSRFSQRRANKASKAQPRLNAIGKPYGASYDPNYKMKYKAGSTAHLFKPYSDNFRKVLSGPIAEWNRTCGR